MIIIDAGTPLTLGQLLDLDAALPGSQLPTRGNILELRDPSQRHLATGRVAYSDPVTKLYTVVLFEVKVPPQPGYWNGRARPEWWTAPLSEALRQFQAEVPQAYIAEPDETATKVAMALARRIAWEDLPEGLSLQNGDGFFEITPAGLDWLVRRRYDGDPRMMKLWFPGLGEKGLRLLQAFLA